MKMVGPSAMNPRDLEIGDEVRITSSDKEFIGVLTEASQDTGLSFSSFNGYLELLISFGDLNQYRFFPKGKTVIRLAAKEVEKEADKELVEVLTLDFFGLNDTLKIITGEKAYIGMVDAIEEREGVLHSLDLCITEGEHKDSVFIFDFTLLKKSKIYAIGQTAQIIADRIPSGNITQNQVDFFVMYEKYQKLPLDDIERRNSLREKMELSAGDNRQLLDALEYITSESNQEHTNAYVSDDAV